jgi:hypothetical protein
LIGVDDGSIAQPVQAHCVRLKTIGHSDACPTMSMQLFENGEGGSSQAQLD